MAYNKVITISYLRLVAGLLVTTVGIIWALVPGELFADVSYAVEWVLTSIFLVSGLMLIISSRQKVREEHSTQE